MDPETERRAEELGAALERGRFEEEQQRLQRGCAVVLAVLVGVLLGVLLLAGLALWVVRSFSES